MRPKINKEMKNSKNYLVESRFKPHMWQRFAGATMPTAIMSVKKLV